MEIIYGRSPKQLPKRGTESKWLPLWEGLRKPKRGEWLGFSASIMKGPDFKTNSSTLRNAARRVSFIIQVAFEEDDNVILVCVKREISGKSAAPSAPPKPAAAKPTPKPAPLPPPAPKPVPAPGLKPLSQSGPKDPAVMATDLEKLLDELIADDDGFWRSADMGSSPSFFATFDRELKTMAKDRGLKIDTDRDGQLLWAQIVSRKQKK
jgi:hypothetical protein